MIAGKLEDELTGTKRATVPENEKAADKATSETTDNKDVNGGADGTRTRDLQRDRAKFRLLEMA